MATASVVQYKLKNEKIPGDLPSIKFTGPSISGLELKRAVLIQRYQSSTDIDLRVVNEQTGQGSCRPSALYFAYITLSLENSPTELKFASCHIRILEFR
jgi:hypothetical protein